MQHHLHDPDQTHNVLGVRLTKVQVGKCERRSGAPEAVKTSGWMTEAAPRPHRLCRLKSMFLLGFLVLLLGSTHPSVLGACMVATIVLHILSLSRQCAL